MTAADIFFGIYALKIKKKDYVKKKDYQFETEDCGAYFTSAGILWYARPSS